MIESLIERREKRGGDGAGEEEKTQTEALSFSLFFEPRPRLLSQTQLSFCLTNPKGETTIFFGLRQIFCFRLHVLFCLKQRRRDKKERRFSFAKFFFFKFFLPFSLSLSLCFMACGRSFCFLNFLPISHSLSHNL